MEKEEHRSNQKGKDILLVILGLVAILSLGFAFWTIQTRNTIASYKDVLEEQVEEPIEKLNDSIDIPGYTNLKFEAGQVKQNIMISNPKQNFCWFKVSLNLEDGRVLWTSNLFAPGENSGCIVLSEPLKQGTYENALLKYECFKDQEGQEALNGVETRLTIIVE
ncbi:MAG: tRNA (uracil-5-)-methyltransferase [Bacillota bacterium]|nr:tRNA (uracil-5-)-methyltransferase [Bacillota bacterium]